MRIVFGGLFFIAALFLVGAGVASANTTNLSSSPLYASQPFASYCNPYISTFENNKHYVAQTGPCVFSVPTAVAGSARAIAIYKGVPGASVFVSGDQFFGTPTLIQENVVTFGTPAQDQEFFSVIYGGASNADINQFHAAFTTGSSTNTLLPSDNYRMIKWKWGGKPAEEYDPVVIVPGILSSWEKNGEWVLDPILHTYDNLVDTFLANGYVEGKTLFKFPYDWKAPNETTAELLGNKIAKIREICGCSKVDVVAHSMGGLVALYYIENSQYKNDIDQLFLVATPLMGSPKAYKAWEGGVLEFGSLKETLFMQVKFTLEARREKYTSVFDYIRNRPIESIHELLPVYTDYLFDTQFNELTYPVNGFLDTLIRNLHKALKVVRVKAILADNGLDNTTISYVAKPSTQLPKWEHGEPVATYTGPGDGTVPRMSIENAFATFKEFYGVDHTTVASTSAPYVFKELNNKEPAVIVGKDYKPNASLLLISLFSPIDMQIIAPDGKRLGKDFTTNTEINEMSDAFYAGFSTDKEYAVIVNPLPGTYTIKTIGTGTGEYTIVSDYITGATSTEAQLVGSTTLTENITHQLALSTTSSNIVLTKDSPTSPQTLTPDSCVSDIATAYSKKWIGKKNIADKLTLDCKALKSLFKTRESLLANTRLTYPQKLLLKGTNTAIEIILKHMELLAKDKGNTKDAVELIYKYTTWFRK